MTFLFDTDMCVYWLRGRTSVRDRIIAVGPQALSISIITLAELRYGAASSTQPDTNHLAIDSFTSAISILGVDAAIARSFGDLKAALRRAGMLLEDFDLIIAATARTYNLTLVTSNIAHFSRVPGLQLENWA
jgi:tRNA(fMet)-specific endonuclease VapC